MRTAWLLSLLFPPAVVEGFGVPRVPVAAIGVARPPTKYRFESNTSLPTTASSSSESTSPDRPLPTIVYKANSSSKWLVTLASTVGIFARLPHYEGPFVVVGAIAATWFTTFLKKLLNHDRPEGAPFTDPGMPSSHSLVCFFLAAGWGTLVCRGVAGPMLWVGASIVALLRVVVGYHSWDQIGVGALMGSSMGFAWARLGRALYQFSPKMTLQASWGLYAVGSALFICGTMKKWVSRDKHL